MLSQVWRRTLASHQGPEVIQASWVRPWIWILEVSCLASPRCQMLSATNARVQYMCKCDVLRTVDVESTYLV